MGLFFDNNTYSKEYSQPRQPEYDLISKIISGDTFRFSGDNADTHLGGEVETFKTAELYGGNIDFSKPDPCIVRQAWVLGLGEAPYEEQVRGVFKRGEQDKLWVLFLLTHIPEDENGQPLYTKPEDISIGYDPVTSPLTLSDLNLPVKRVRLGTTKDGKYFIGDILVETPTKTYVLLSTILKENGWSVAENERYFAAQFARAQYEIAQRDAQNRGILGTAFDGFQKFVTGFSRNAEDADK